MDLFEQGDHILVTTGYNKGKVGTVIRHPNATANIIYELAGRNYHNADADDYDEDHNDYYGEYEDSPARFLKYISKTEYEETLNKLKILEVPGLPVSVRFYGKNLIIGDNVITPANAKKIAEFIESNIPKTKGKKK